MREPHVEDAIRRVLNRRRQNAPGLCPDANELAAFLEDRLTPAERTCFEEHAADCTPCQEALALALQLDAAEEHSAAHSISEPRGFAYRTSPIRLVFAAAVVVVVGVLLFQATRRSQPPLQKPSAAARQNPSDVSGGPEAELRSRETKTPSIEAPGASIAFSTRKPAGEPAQSQASQPPVVTRPAAVPAPAVVQVGPEARQLARPQVSAYADASKFALGETTKAELRQNTIPSADNKALNMEMAANRFEEAKAKAVSQPAGQIPQQGNVAILQNAPLNQQVAVDQANVVKAQGAVNVSERGAGVALPAAEEKKRTEPDQKAQAGRAADAVTQAQDGRILALRSTIAGVKGNRASLAIEEARPLLKKDPSGDTAKKIGQRLFYRTTNYWVDAGCLAHSEAPTVEIARGSKEFADILGREPNLAQLQAPDVPILLFWNGVNYLIR